VHQPPVVVVEAAATVVEVVPDFATVVVVPAPNSDATMSTNFAADSGNGICVPGATYATAIAISSFKILTFEKSVM
jgi:hypothetical protein